MRFSITDSSSGDTLTIESDKAPTQSDADEIFKSRSTTSTGTSKPEQQILKPTPYEAADLAAGGKAETGMESGTGFTEAIAKDVIPAVEKAYQFATTSLIPKQSAKSLSKQIALEGEITPTAAQEESGVNVGAISDTKAGKIIGGVAKAGMDTAEFFSSPLGIATLGVGTLPKLAQKIVAGTFSAQMALQVPEIYTKITDELKKPEMQRDYGKIAEWTTAGALNVGFAAMGAMHVLTPEPKTTLTDTAVKGPSGDLSVTADSIKPVAPLTAEALKTIGVPNATEIGKQPESNQPEHIGTAALGLPGETVNSDSNVQGGKEQAVSGTGEAPLQEPTQPTAGSVVPDYDPEDIGSKERIRKKIESGMSREQAVSEASKETQDTRDWIDENTTHGDVLLTKEGYVFYNDHGQWVKIEHTGVTGITIADLSQLRGAKIIRRGFKFSEAESLKGNFVKTVVSGVDRFDFREDSVNESTTKSDNAKPLESGVVPLNPGGALADLPPELQAKSNSVQDAMRAQFEQLKAKQAELDKSKEQTEPAPEQKYKVGNNPQTWSLVERLKATPTEIVNGEQPVKIKNDKTGDEQTVLESDLKAVSTSTEPKAPKRDLDAELRAAGMDPSGFDNAKQKKLALKRSEALQGAVGMGGALKEGEPSKPELAQLADSITTLAEQSPATSKVSEAFDLGERIETLKNGISEKVSGLKAAGQYLKQKLINEPIVTDIKSAIGERGLSLAESADNARKFSKASEKAIPDKLTQEAISDYIDSGGDKEFLDRAANETKSKYKAGYEASKDLTPEQKTIADNIRNYFESRLQDAIDAGILEDGLEDYIHRIYESDSPWKEGVLSELRSGIFTGRPALAKQRVFEYDLDAEKAGKKPIKSFIKRVAAYDLSLNKAIADRELVKKMMQIKMSDGRPMIDVAGIGMPIKEGDTTKATLIRPSFKPFDETSPENNRGDYKSIDYPALRKWKWVTKDAEGKDIFVQGDVLVHPEAIKQVKALFERSAIRANPIGRLALSASATVKQTMLDLSGFHLVQIAVHGMEHRTFKPVKEIDFTDPDTRGLIKGGMMVGDTTGRELFSEGLTGSSLTKHIPGIGPKLQDWNDWLFNSYIPRLKTATGLHALERNRERFPELSQEQLYHQTAMQMNAAFGELNYDMMARSQTTRDVLRLALLAPDFLEARGRFVAQSGTKYGREQFTALMLGAATMYVTARIINKLLSGEYHFEPKNAFSVVHNNKAYSLRTVQGDLLHLFTEPGRFLYNRLNPLFGRTSLEFLTGRDAFGRNRSYSEQLKDLAETVVPISLKGLLHPREQNLLESFLNAFGVTERRSTSTSTVYDMVDKFKKANKIRTDPGEFIYDPEKDPYRPVRQASEFSSPETVAGEIEKAVKVGNVTLQQMQAHFNRYANSPFTGSAANESKFVKSLSEDDHKIYLDAKQEKRDVLKKFNAGAKIYREKKKPVDNP